MTLSATTQEIFDASNAVPLGSYLDDALQSLELVPADKIELPESLEAFLENIIAKTKATV